MAAAEAAEAVGRWGEAVKEQLGSLETSVWVAVVVASAVVLTALPYLKNLGKNLPPGPPSWPVLGSLPYLGGELHQVLCDLAKKHGPVMRVGLGQYTLIVVSSAEAAEEVMRKRDAEFPHRSARTIQRSAAKYVGIDSNDIAFSEYNSQLRLLRKFCTTELFTQARMAASAKIRTTELSILISSVAEAAKKGESIPVREYLHTTTMNSICQMLFGKRYYGLDAATETAESANFARVVRDVFENVGRLNLADLIPALRWFDLQGIEAEWKRIRPQAEEILGTIIQEHREKRERMSGKGDAPAASTMDFVDVLLTPLGNESLSDKAIMGTLFDMIMGGTDTTATTIEWCLVEVVRHPDQTRRLQAEIDEVVGAEERQVEESDLPRLPFLQAFVKEIFRLHTSVPIMLPRLNDRATTLGGYDIPPLCTVFVNSYAIAHDPRSWARPSEFDPDRFLAGNASAGIGLSGTDFELLPFGSGRRKCVGIQLGIAFVSRALAALVQAFDWAPPSGVRPLDVDISESYKVVLRNLVPLRATATARPALRYFHPSSSSV